MRRYGVFLIYPPSVDMRKEGLGRYLAAFVRAATEQSDVYLVISCPSWSRKTLKELFKDARITEDRYEFCGPVKRPLLLWLYEWRYGAQKKPARAWTRIGKVVKRYGTSAALSFAETLGGARTPFGWFLALCALIVLGTIALPFLLLFYALGFGRGLFNSAGRRFVRFIRLRLNRASARLGQWLNGRVPTLQWLAFEGMKRHEADLMLEKIKNSTDVRAWYVPSAFWPQVSEIPAPVLICLPDIVLQEFPAGFAETGNSTLTAYRDIKRTIDGNKYFVTYSGHIKQSILCEQFGVPSEDVRVISHAPNELGSSVHLVNTPNPREASLHFARNVFRSALKKGLHAEYLAGWDNPDVKYIFYASQFRPSKNIENMLRAYEFLKSEKLFSHKIILTGNPAHMPEIRDFIENNKLSYDVLCLVGLSEQELAACYKLADLAICPSFSEGGMPFTFTEAVSVGTPCIMSDIAVTREVIVDPELRNATLFDPYDWQAMAKKILWGLENRDFLYELERRFYDDVLIKRTWADVVDEHFAFMDEIALKEAQVSIG